MMLDNVLIHIGYHKTGTTWLQNEIFTSKSDCFIPISKYTEGASTLARDFIYNREGYLINSFDNNGQVILESLNQITDNVPDLSSKFSVISHERLSGNPHSSGFDSSVIARRIKNVFPNAKILIVIREQCSWILSNYFQYLSIGGNHSIKKYLNTKYDGKRPGFSPSHLEYHFLIKDYQLKFGKENVLVLPYELFDSDKAAFFQRLGKFIDRDIQLPQKSIFSKRHNTKTNHYSNYKFRFLNTFIHSSSVNNYSSVKNRISKRLAISIMKQLSRLFSRKFDQRIQDDLKKQIVIWSNERFVASNIITQNLTNLKLSEFNYKTTTNKT